MRQVAEAETQQALDVGVVGIDGRPGRMPGADAGVSAVAGAGAGAGASSTVLSSDSSGSSMPVISEMSGAWYASAGVSAMILFCLAAQPVRTSAENIPAFKRVAAIFIGATLPFFPRGMAGTARCHVHETRRPPGLFEPLGTAPSALGRTCDGATT